MKQTLTETLNERGARSRSRATRPVVNAFHAQ